MPKENIPALTGLRFFAALAIVFWHSRAGYFFQLGAFEPFYLAGAVPLFFVLSGFVLALSAGKYASWSDFMAARIARIWPAHLAALAFFFLIFWPHSQNFFHHARTLLDLALNVFLVQAWAPDRLTYWSYNAVSWSASCELFFYAAFPLCLAIVSRAPVIIAAVSFVATFLSVSIVGITFPGIDLIWIALTAPPICLCAFIIGGSAGVIWSRGREDNQDRTAIQLTALVAMLAANAAFNIFPKMGAAGIFFGAFGPAPFYAAFIVSLTYRGTVSRFLSRPVIVYGGEISYSIYLFHQLVIRWHMGHVLAMPKWLQYAAIIIATLLLATASHRFIERPGRRMMLAVYRRHARFPPHVAGGVADASAAEYAAGVNSRVWGP